jgi:AraC-like DNA-binding protein
MIRVPRDDPRKSIPAPAGYVRFLLKRFGTTEALRAALIHGTDIDETRLQQSGAEVTLYTFVTLSQNLTREIGEAWPLDAMAAWSNAMQGALEVAVRSAPTVGDGMDVVRRFGHVRAPFLGIELQRDRKSLNLLCRNTVEIEPAAWRSLSLTVMLGVTGMLAPLMEGRASEMEVRFPWPQPSYVTRLRDALAAQVAFGGKELSLSVPLGLCAEPLPFADVRLHASAIAELESTSGRIHASNRLLLKLQDLLSRKRRGRLNEEEAALELGMSRRTLVRRLSESGTSFRQLLDAELKARARGMLDEGTLSRTEMAEALGFDDPTSFSRACRRWFGETRP